MKKKIYLLPLTILSAILLLSNLDGAFPENTGAPGELTCGRAPCHNVPVNVGTAQMAIEYGGENNQYFADSTYQLTVKIAGEQTMRNGFEILALNSSNQNIGTWQLLDPDKMKIINGIGLPSRKYVTHRAAGNLQTEWTVAWEAPAIDAGPITFYASVNSTNDNGLNTGDEVYTSSISINFAEPLANSEVAFRPGFGFVHISPNPASEAVQVRYFLEKTVDVHIDVLNILGQKVARFYSEKQMPGEYNVTWNGNTAAGLRAQPGLYFVRLSAGDEAVTERVVWR